MTSDAHEPATTTSESAPQRVEPPVGGDTDPRARQEFGAAVLDHTWAQLRQQQDEYEQRSVQLETLRHKLEDLLARQNQLITEKDHASPVSAAEVEASDDVGRTSLDSDLALDRPSPAIHEDHSPVEGHLQDVARDYRHRIELLEQEKLEITARMSELQQQIDHWEAHGGRAVTSRRATRSWQLALALLLGLGLGTYLIFRTEARFEVHTVIRADAQKCSTTQLRDHASRLAAAAARQMENPEVSDLLSDIEVRPDPQNLELALIARTSRQSHAAHRLQLLAEQFIADTELMRQQRIEQLHRELQQAEHAVERRRHEYKSTLAELADQRLATEVSNPHDQLQDILKALSDARQELTAIQDELQLAITELDRLQFADVPSDPEVDVDARREAESQDLYLKQDLDALLVRLNQLRHHLLDAFNDGPTEIQAYLAAANSLRTFLDTEKRNLQDRKVATAVEDLATQAAKLQQLIIDLERQWTRLADELRNLEIDPRRKDCLEIQRQLEIVVKDFNFDAEEMLTALQTNYQQLPQAMNNPAEHFKFRTALVAHIKSLAQRQLAFAEFAKRVIPTSDFQLDAMLHSVVGLTRRVRDRQNDIEQSLTASKRDRLKSALTEQREAHRTRIAELTRQRDLGLTNLLKLQEQLSALIPAVEEHGAARTRVEYLQDEVDDLLVSIDPLEQGKSQLLASIAELETGAGVLRLDPTQAGSRPIETLQRMYVIGSGSMVGAVAAYMLISLLFTVIGSPRRP